MAPRPSSVADLAHLLRRTTFGPDLETWPRWRHRPYDEALDRLLAGLDAPPTSDPRQANGAAFDPFAPGHIQSAWMDRLIDSDAPLAEVLTFFWHGHFATSDAKVQDPGLLWGQMQLLRRHGAGPFRVLLGRVLRDPAMLRWLDGNANRSGHPNENLGRELLELFTLGVGAYDELDVREVARALTGHGTKGRTHHFDARFHDDGSKTILGRRGTFDVDDVVDILCATAACRQFIARRLLEFFADPEAPLVEIERIAKRLEETNFEIRAGVEAILRGDYFRDRARRQRRVRSPVAFTAAALRATGVRPSPEATVSRLSSMGQTLFRPPSVKGWPSGADWLTASGLVARIDAARWIAAAADTQNAHGILDAAFGGEPPRGALAHVLSKTEGEHQLALALASPEFQVA